MYGKLSLYSTYLYKQGAKQHTKQHTKQYTKEYTKEYRKQHTKQKINELVIDLSYRELGRLLSQCPKKVIQS